jgi:hypothetical protein
MVRFFFAAILLYDEFGRAASALRTSGALRASRRAIRSITCFVSLRRWFRYYPSRKKKCHLNWKSNFTQKKHHLADKTSKNTLI